MMSSSAFHLPFKLFAILNIPSTQLRFFKKGLFPFYPTCFTARFWAAHRLPCHYSTPWKIDILYISISLHTPFPTPKLPDTLLPSFLASLKKENEVQKFKLQLLRLSEVTRRAIFNSYLGFLLSSISSSHCRIAIVKSEAFLFSTFHLHYSSL